MGELQPPDQGNAAGALRAWDRLRATQPASFGLVAEDYAAAARACGQTAAARSAVEALYARMPSMALLRALTALDPPGQSEVGRLVEHLQAAPSLSAAQALLAEPPDQWGEAGLKAVRKAVDRAAAPLRRYRCAACGFEAEHWFWQCPGCLGWDSFPPQPVEEL